MNFDANSNRNGAVFLRFIAIILVINSHMDILYPVQWLATGGAIGNSLFFMLSSYGLLLSEKSNHQSFSGYFIKRINRIYPAVWVNILLFVLPLAAFYYFTSPFWYAEIVSEFALNQPLSLLGVIFYPPTAHWFLQALMLFYLFGFFFISNYSFKKLSVGFLFLSLLYIFFYLQFSDYSSWVTESTLLFKIIFYAMIFLSGIYFAAINERIIYRGIVDWLALLLMLIVIYVHKFMMLNGFSGELQFIEQLAIFPLLYYCLKVSKSTFVIETLMKQPVIAGFISVIAAMTLELYMVHGATRILIHQFIATFPVNVILYLLITFMISYGLYRFTQYMMFRIFNQMMIKP